MKNQIQFSSEIVPQSTLPKIKYAIKSKGPKTSQHLSQKKQMCQWSEFFTCFKQTDKQLF